MSELRSGRVVEATVTGFLPGRRVVLDVDGETLLAWSNLPLVRGAVIRASVEPAGAGLRLRLVEERRALETGGTHLALSPQGTASDELDVVIAKTAEDLGLLLDERLVFEVKDGLRILETRLEREPVPLRRLSGEIRSLLMLRTRGLAPSVRLRWIMDRNGGTRLGTALLKAAESLTSAARAFGRDIGAVLEHRAITLERFFLDLDSAALAPNLGGVLRRCGYSHEMDRARLEETGGKGG